jgi:hypothetical protein
MACSASGREGQKGGIRGGKAQHHPGLCFSRTGFEQALGAQTGRA